MPRYRHRKLSPEQRAFLRTRLGPAIGGLGFDLARTLPKIIRDAVEAGPGKRTKPGPFAFISLAFAALGVGLDIRHAVLTGADPEQTYNDVIDSLRPALETVLAGLGANVGPTVATVAEAVGDAFAARGVWDVLEDAADLFPPR